MVLIGCAILPHGSMILDPTYEDIPAGVDELHSASKYVGDYVRDHEPDIVVIATPHGLNLSESIGVYASSIGIGSADWNKSWSDFRVSCNFHDEFATDIYNHLQVYDFTLCIILIIVVRRYVLYKHYTDTYFTILEKADKLKFDSTFR